MSSTKLGDITIAKKSGTNLELYTEGMYVSTDVSFGISAQEAVTAYDSATADVDISSQSHSVNAENISGSVGARTTTPPTSGYYLRMEASGSGRSKVTSGGWVDAGSLPEATASKTEFFPVNGATASVSGTNTVTPSASVSGSNVTLSNTDNGISVSATGGGTASASAVAQSNQAGYVPANTNIATGTIAASSQSTVASTFIAGVTLAKPASGTRSFSITVPNGDSTQTVTFTVDSNGNVYVD